MLAHTLKNPDVSVLLLYHRYVLSLITHMTLAAETKYFLDVGLTVVTCGGGVLESPTGTSSSLGLLDIPK